MAENSSIEWTTHTFNPWIGCTKVSPGCAHCYAETLMDTRYGRVRWGKGQPRSRTAADNWRKPKQWNRIAGCFPANGRPRVFCASLADWLDDEVPIEWLSDLLELIAATPNLDWLLLTKRPENWYRRVSLAVGEMAESWIDCIDMPERGIIPANVWIGTTVEDQTRANERIPHLLKIPARVRFLSMEPLLGPVDLMDLADDPDFRGALIDWVIAGGESGPKARPMHPDWARSIRDQCVAAGVPFFMKQWGEWCPATGEFGVTGSVMPDTGEKFRWIGWDGKTQNPSAKGLVDPIMAIARQGKARLGRLLDGREWNEFPAALPLDASTAAP